MQWSEDCPTYRLHRTITPSLRSVDDSVFIFIRECVKYSDIITRTKNSPTHGVKSLFNLFLTTKKRTRTDDDETVYLIILKKKITNV